MLCRILFAKEGAGMARRVQQEPENLLRTKWRANEISNRNETINLLNFCDENELEGAPRLVCYS